MSGPTSPPTGQLQDAMSVRLRTSSQLLDQNVDDFGTDYSDTFDSEGFVWGRIEVKPSPPQEGVGYNYGDGCLGGRH